MQLCDLHTHSTRSDGTCSPSEVLRLAKSAGLSAVALTDHNTIAGLDEFLEESKKFDIQAVSGVEITSEYNGIELHVVALFLDRKDFSVINDFLAIQKNRKEENNKLLADRLCERGYKIDYESIKAKASGTINRVHFAKELVEKGYISSVEEGFNTILSEKNGVYIPPKRLTTFEVLTFIKSINAVSVLAHPLLCFTENELVEFLVEALPYGLDAIEVRYSKYTTAQQEFSEKIAREFNLKMSGGSDFHGKNKPDIKIGVGKGNLQVPLDFLKNLECSKN